VPGQVKQLFDQVLTVGKDALAHGIHVAFLDSLVIGGLIILVTFFLKDVPLITRQVSMAEGAEPLIPEMAAVEAEATALGMAQASTPLSSPLSAPRMEGAPRLGMEGA
jgi:hypothetical protein